MKALYQCIVSSTFFLLMGSFSSAPLAATPLAEEAGTLHIRYHVDPWAELEVKGNAMVTFDPQTHALNKSFNIVSRTNVENAVIVAKFTGHLINIKDETKKISYVVKHNNKSFEGSPDGVALIENPSVGEQTHTVQIELDLHDTEIASLGDYKGSLTLQISAA